MKNASRKNGHVVTWNDAHADLDEVNLDEVRAGHHPTIIRTTGYIILSDEAGVSIAGEHIPNNQGGDDTFRSVSFIPRGMVISEQSFSMITTRKKRERKAAATEQSGAAVISAPEVA
jgi:hypothetical protein